MSNRISWEEFFMEQAIIFSKRATCQRLKVGSIITSKNNMQLAEGFNGSISGQPHCEDVGCLKNDEGRCIRTIHSEQNALLNAMKKGVSVVGGIAYVTHEPCETCTKLLLQSGIEEIVYLVGYENKYNKEFLKHSNVIFREYKGDGKERLLKMVSDIKGGLIK